MEQILPENWAILHLGMIFSITLAQMLVIYVLSDSSNPPEGLGLFTVYFMAALLGWIAATLQQGTQSPMTLNVPAVAAIINSYILFLAAGQRSAQDRGRIILGALCLLGVLSVFFVNPQQMFVVHAALSGLFFIATGVLCTRRSLKHRNVGDAIMAHAALLIVCATPIALYQLLVAGNTDLAQTILLAAHSWAYALVAVGFLASVLIEYQQYLSHLATQDPLTRLLNRRGLEDALRLSLAQASRQRLTTTAIRVDIDHFKNVNDSFGHETGDNVIRRVATVLERLCRASDVVARTGGDEFLIVLTDTDLESAQVLAQRIRSYIGDRSLLIDQQRIPVTVSLGLAACQGETALDTLLQEADRALYLAKHSGRNRVATIENNPIHLSSNATSEDS